MADIVSGTGDIRMVPTGPLIRPQLNRWVRFVHAQSPPNIEFSGFLSNALTDGTVVGRSLVVDHTQDSNDVPDATGYGVITLRNVTVQGPFTHPPSPTRVGTLVLEQRVRSVGLIDIDRGVTSSVQYTVLEGRDGLSSLRGGVGVGVGFGSKAGGTANYWLQLEFP